MNRENVFFVLVRTQFAPNLGSTVRVMENMGFKSLILVRPECAVGMEARSFAMKGAGILDRADVLPSLEEVVQQIPLLVGTTGRFRGKRSRLASCRNFCRDVLPKLAGSPVGIVFGPEDNGLRREELRLCQWLVEIPAGPKYPILNLAQAAAIFSYEMHMALSSSEPGHKLRPADAGELASLLEHVETTLARLGLQRSISVPRLMKRIRRVVARASLEHEDVKMLRGLLSALQQKRVGGRSDE